MKRRDRVDRGSWEDMVCERRFRGGETREFMVVASLRGDCWERNRISFGSIFDNTMSSFFLHNYNNNN